MGRKLVVLLAVLGALASSGTASAGTFTQQDSFVTMSDGVQIATTLFEPTGAPPPGGWPAVMIFHGLGQTRKSTELNNISWNDVASTLLAPNGYAVLTFDARAHGESGGLMTLDGPRELQDTKELFAWLVAHPGIDAKKVGAFGVSYGGGNVWLSTLAGVPFATIVPAATWTDLHEMLAPGNAGRSGIVLAFASNVPQSRWAPDLASMLSDALAGRNVDALRAFQAARSVRTRLAQIGIPVFVIQGRRDFAFDADQALAAYRALRGPKRIYLGDLGHAPATNPPAEWPHVADEVRAWFDHWLKGAPNDVGAPVEIAPDPWGTRAPATAKRLPATRTLRFVLRGTSTIGDSSTISRSTGRVRHVETFGAPVVRVSIASRTGYEHVVAALTAVEPGGRVVTVSEGGAGFLSLGAKPRTVAIRLQDEVTSIPAGSRLRVSVGAISAPGATPLYLNPVAVGSKATVGRVTLTLSVLAKPISR